MALLAISETGERTWNHRTAAEIMNALNAPKQSFISHDTVTWEGIRCKGKKQGLWHCFCTIDDMRIEKYLVVFDDDQIVEPITILDAARDALERECFFRTVMSDDSVQFQQLIERVNLVLATYQTPDAIHQVIPILQAHGVMIPMHCIPVLRAAFAISLKDAITWVHGQIPTELCEQSN